MPYFIQVRMRPNHAGIADERVLLMSFIISHGLSPDRWTADKSMVGAIKAD